MSRTIAIGDIHGCATALASLLDAIALQPGGTLVTMGDYVDRGMESQKVIEILMELMGRTRLIPLMGNHEVMMLQALKDRQAFNFWLQHGGQQTLQSYGGKLEKIPQQHLIFLQHCLKHWENEDHFFVHANYLANQSLEETPDEILFWQHMKLAFPLPHINGKKAWVGHTPQDGGNIQDLGHVALIDTHCYDDGFLSAVDVDSGDFWQVKMDGSMRVLEPAEDHNG